jgi:CDGSH iron-sulfur domain-containing protein 3
MYANQPTIVDETPGKKAYCTCGNSSNKPYCDGSHRGTGKSPTMFEITEEKKVFVCDCGKTTNSPFCNGNHAK